MKKVSLFITSCLFIMALFQTNLQAQTDKPYTDGPVWMISFVKTKTGMSDTYLKDLAMHWAKYLKVAKERGIIMDFKAIGTSAANPADWELMLMIEVKNFAAIDDIDKKMDALAVEILGPDDKQQENRVNRNSYRDILGEKLGREIIFK
jgi:hypothetical protein